jgi:hypothetical protein
MPNSITRTSNWLVVSIVLIAMPVAHAAPESAVPLLPVDYQAMQSNAMSSENTRSRSSREWLVDEMGIILLSGLAAYEPENMGILLLLAAPLNYLAMDGDARVSQTERVIVAAATVSLALYNYDVDEDENSEEDIFLTNFLVWNLMLLTTNLHEVESAYNPYAAGSSFSLQTDRENTPLLVWNYRF